MPTKRSKTHKGTFTLSNAPVESANAPLVKHYELSEYLAMIESERNEAKEKGKDWNEGNRA